MGPDGCPEPPECPIRPDERLLNDVLDVDVGTRDEVRHAGGDVLVPPNELSVRIRIAVLCLLDELGILQWTALHEGDLHIGSYTEHASSVPN